MTQTGRALVVYGGWDGHQPREVAQILRRILAEEGFVYDSSIYPVVHDRYGFPDAPRFAHRGPGGSDLDLWEGGR